MIPLPRLLIAEAFPITTSQLFCFSDAIALLSQSATRQQQCRYSELSTIGEQHFGMSVYIGVTPSSPGKLSSLKPSTEETRRIGEPDLQKITFQSAQRSERQAEHASTCASPVTENSSTLRITRITPTCLRFNVQARTCSQQLRQHYVAQKGNFLQV